MNYGNLEYNDDLSPIEFKETFKKLNLNENKHKIADMCINKDGSRIIQELIETKEKDNIYLIYDAIKDNIFNITNDQSGNYCIQKILENNIDDINTNIIELLLNNIINTSLNPYGSKVIQKI